MNDKSIRPGRVLCRIYDLPVDDPIEIIADYKQEELILSKAHDAIGGAGLTISCHGSGSIWLTWEDVPVVIEALQIVLRDAGLSVPNTPISGSAPDQNSPSQPSNTTKSPCPQS